jgi:hypothetical protein
MEEEVWMLGSGYVSSMGSHDALILKIECAEAILLVESQVVCDRSDCGDRDSLFLPCNGFRRDRWRERPVALADSSALQATASSLDRYCARSNTDNVLDIDPVGVAISVDGKRDIQPSQWSVGREQVELLAHEGEPYRELRADNAGDYDTTSQIDRVSCTR